MKLSIVATLYQSAAYINEFYARATSAARKSFQENYEIIFVNDGSPDESLDKAIELTKIDSHIIVVDLSRNFGHHNAMLTGLKHAKGDAIFLIDVDLEESPEWLELFSARMKSDQSDVIFGVQETRKGGRIENYSGSFFYKMFKALSGIDLPENLMTARLMSRRYVNALLLYEEKDLFLGGLMHITGFKQVAIPLKKLSKTTTSYTLKKRISLLVKAITSFSSAPLLYIFFIGLFVFSVSLIFGFTVLVKWMVGGIGVPGWVSIILSIWGLGGLLLMSIGILGIYTSKIFIEVKSRPISIVKGVYENEATK